MKKLELDKAWELRGRWRQHSVAQWQVRKNQSLKSGEVTEQTEMKATNRNHQPQATATYSNIRQHSAISRFTMWFHTQPAVCSICSLPPEKADWLQPTFQRVSKSFCVHTAMRDDASSFNYGIVPGLEKASASHRTTLSLSISQVGGHTGGFLLFASLLPLGAALDFNMSKQMLRWLGCCSWRAYHLPMQLWLCDNVWQHHSEFRLALLLFNIFYIILQVTAFLRCSIECLWFLAVTRGCLGICIYSAWFA